MKRRGFIGLAVATAVALASPTMAQSRSLSLGTQTNADAFLAPGIQAYADRIEELTNGELTVDIFWSAQLGSAAQMNQAIVAGALDLEFNVSELLSAFEPRLGVMTMPLVFRDRTHFAHFLGSDTFDSMLATLASKGIIFPGRADFKDPATAVNWVRPWDRGLVTNRPVYSPKDLEGFKLRLYESEIPIKSWQALGANVQVVPWPDVYTSLATGIVDGLTGTVVDNYERKHFENAPYWTNVHEYFQIQLPYMSKITYDSLTPAQQKAVEQATSETGPIIKALMDTADDAARDKAQAEFGVSFIEPPIGPWIAKMAPAHADFETRGLIEKGLIEKIQAIE
jgi:TRAP-type C4-dicarboxylate transport system substrate-binding protein